MHLFNKAYKLFAPDENAASADDKDLENKNEENLNPETPAAEVNNSEQEQEFDMSSLKTVEDTEDFLDKLNPTFEQEEAPDEGNKADSESDKESETDKPEAKGSEAEKPENEQPPKKPEEAPAKKVDQEQPKDSLVLSDEVLNKIVSEKFADKSDEEKAKFLNKIEQFKGKSLDEIATALAHSQVQIDKLNTDRSKERKQELFKSSPQGKNIIDKDRPEEITSEYRNTLIMNRLKNEGILPEDQVEPPNLDLKSEEFKQWYRDFNYEDPISAREFVDGLSKETKFVDDALQQAQYLEQNYENVISGQEKEIAKITQDWFKNKVGIDNLKDYGFDFTPDEKDNSIVLVYNLIFDKEDGEPDPNCVEHVFGRTPVLKPEGIVRKFIEKNLPDILAKRDKQKVADARKEAFDAKGNPKELPPSLGPTPPQKKEEVNVSDISQAKTVENIDEVLAKIPLK